MRALRERMRLACGTGALALGLVVVGGGGCVSSSVLSDVDVSGSVIVVNPASAPADGSSIAVTVSVRDVRGRVYAGYPVVLTAQNCTVTQPTRVTDANGEVGGAVACATPGAALITAQTLVSEYSLPLPRTALVTFYAPANQTGGVSSGTPLSVQAVVRGPSGRVDIGSGHTVAVTSSDPNAVLPPAHTMTAADAGTYLWSNSIALHTPGEQTLTTIDTTADKTLWSGTLRVVAPDAMSFDATWSTNGTDGNTARVGQALALTLSAFDSLGHAFTNYTGTVTFTSSDPNASLPRTYTFNANDAGVHVFDAIVLRTLGRQSVTIRDAGGVSLAVVPITMAAGPATALSFTLPQAARAGDVLHFTAYAYDVYGNPATAFADTLHFVSTDPLCDKPEDYTFGPSDAGSREFDVTFRTSGTQQLVVQDANNSTVAGQRQSVAIVSVSATALQVTPVSGAVSGSPVAITITAVDNAGNVAVGYTGTVRFSGSDNRATYLAPYTFQTADHGSKTLQGAATFLQAGVQTFTAQDALASGLAGHGNVTVVSAQAAALQLVIPAVFVSQQPNTVIVRSIDAYGNTAPGYTGTLHFTTTDGNGIWPTDTTFTSGNAGVLTLTNQLSYALAGNAGLQVRDTNVPTLHAGATTYVVPGPAAHIYLYSNDYAFAENYVGQGLFPYMVLQDAWGNICTNYTGTIQGSSSDPAASISLSYTYGPGDHGGHTFAVTLNTIGPQTVTFSDTHDPNVTDTQYTYVLHPADGRYQTGFTTFNGQASAGGRAFAPSFTLDANLYPRMAWNDEANGSRIYYLQWNGTGWVSLHNSASALGVSQSPNLLYSPSLANDGNGQPAIAWEDWDNAYAGSSIAIAFWDAGTAQWLGYAGSDIGGGVTGDHSISQKAPALAFDSAGHPVVAWFANTSPTDYPDIYVQTFDGAAWQNVGASLNISNQNGQSFYPSLAIDSADHPWVAWQQGWNPAEIYLRRFDGANWVAVGGSDTGGGISNNAGNSIQPALVLDGNDQPWVAWSDDSNGNLQIYVRTFVSGAWIDMAGSGSGGGISSGSRGAWNPDLALDGNGRPTVVWSTKTDVDTSRSTIFLRFWDGAAWQQSYGSAEGSGTGMAYVDRAYGTPVQKIRILPSGQALVCFSSDTYNNSNFQVRIAGWP